MSTYVQPGLDLWATCRRITINVLVTGGAGYIGSHACKLLAERGVEPVVFDNLCTGHASAVQWGPFVKGDLADTELLRRTMHEHDIDGVLHFAAHAYVGESTANPRKYFRNNVVNSLNLLEAMVDSGVQHIVFSSSCTVYGVPDRTPISEDQEQRPISPYGESKLMVERMLRWFGDAYGLHWMSLRYFNAAGADPEGQLGENHQPETHLIPLVLGAASDAAAALSVFGTDYPTPDGTAIRDYIHVTDLAEAHWLALDHLRAGKESAVLNLGTGVGYSVFEVMRAAEAICQRPIRFDAAPRRAGDPAVLVAGAGRATAVLGWKPTRSDLTFILETAWRWHEKKT
jgi:UDP-arabinose 4-epimerase